MNADIVVVGQVARDLVLVVPEVPSTGGTVDVRERLEMLGGKGANIAVAATQLGSRVRLVGVVGGDSVGDCLIKQLSADGVETTDVVRRPGATSGLVVNVVTPDGKWRYLEDLPEDMLVSETDINALMFQGAESAIIQLQQPPATALAAATYARAAGCRVVLDGNPADDRLLAVADVLRADQQEGELLTGVELDSAGSAVEAGRKLLARGPDLIALATKDANVFVWDGGELTIPLGDTKVRDTTGGGDSFVAALTVGLNQGRTTEEAAQMAVSASGDTVSHPGGRPHLN